MRGLARFVGDRGVSVGVYHGPYCNTRFRSVFCPHGGGAG